ncbi:MAG TPA: DUF3016 domain-containing protein [Rhodanobacteraceae bacterium]
MNARRSFRFTAALFGLALAAVFCVAGAAPTVAPQASVTVDYHDPHNFTESRQAGFGHEYDHGDYLQKLRAFLIQRATPLLAPGEHLNITFTNIKLAGGYEPWRGPLWDDVRFMRDIYPPRFDFTFTLTGADGQVVRQGTRKLTDLGYLYDLSPSLYNTDALAYDKALLGRWLRKGPKHW